MLEQIQAHDTDLEVQTVIPFVRELPADLDTPVTVYLKLAGGGPSFLLESVTGGEQIARYSFIGVGLQKAYVLRGRTLFIHSPGQVEQLEIPRAKDPLDMLRAEMEHFQITRVPGLPRFSGGFVGYLGYETAAFFEPSVRNASFVQHARKAELPDAIFLQADTVVAFDHAFGRLLMIANVNTCGDPVRDSREAQDRLDALEARLSRPLSFQLGDQTPTEQVNLQSNTTREAFIQAVTQAKEHIAAGDIFQVVLSQKFYRQTSASPFGIYRELRRLNPSPYMFFFDFEHLAGSEPLRLIGASPEMHVRLEEQVATIRPIAGTRPRGKTTQEDARLEGELLADPKECAEHVMLVDLARNDLGRVCEFGSVHVPELMGIERYSHVMHIVSHVQGRLRPDLDNFDLMRATFPAGTVSGAPKVRAMQIIADLESQPRGPYAGAVGYFSQDGSMDTCILIRTLVMQGQTISVQAGAGIVADSDPEREYQETINKARALAVAVEKAETAEAKTIITTTGGLKNDRRDR